MKTYAKYGKVFQTLRKQKGFKLSAFAYLGISSASLCKFENGKSMIKFDSLVLALSELSITLSEYEKCLNNFELDVDEQLVLQTIASIVSGNKSLLINLYSDAIKMGDKACALALKSTYDKINSKEVDWLYNYFENLYFWRSVDLCALYLSIDFLKPRQLAYILDGFFINNNQRNILNSLVHRLEFAHVLCRSIIFLSFKGYDELSRHFLNFLAPQVFSHTMYTKNLYNFASGYWQSLFRDFNLGNTKMNVSLTNFKNLSDTPIYKYYQDLYNQFVPKSKIN